MLQYVVGTQRSKDAFCIHISNFFYSKEHAYPCIRGFHFVNLFMMANPIYPEVLKAGKSGKTVLLDLGCCSEFTYTVVVLYT